MNGMRDFEKGEARRRNEVRVLRVGCVESVQVALLLIHPDSEALAADREMRRKRQMVNISQCLSIMIPFSCLEPHALSFSLFSWSKERSHRKTA